MAGDPGPAHTARVRPWIVVVLVGVALVLGAATLLLAVHGPSAIRPGPGTATITWTGVGQGASGLPTPQPFTGDIEGHPLHGTSTFVLPTGVTPVGSASVVRYRGTFAGRPFDLTVSFTFPVLPQNEIATARSDQYVPHITVRGTWNGSPVRATVVSPSGAGPTADRPAHFSGTIGGHHVTGTIPVPTGTGGHQTVTASFVVG